MCREAAQPSALRGCVVHSAGAGTGSQAPAPRVRGFKYSHSGRFKYRVSRTVPFVALSPGGPRQGPRRGGADRRAAERVRLPACRVTSYLPALTSTPSAFLHYLYLSPLSMRCRRVSTSRPRERMVALTHSAIRGGCGSLPRQCQAMLRPRVLIAHCCGLLLPRCVLLST